MHRSRRSTINGLNLKNFRTSWKAQTSHGNLSLTAVETRLSPLTGVRKAVEVILAYTNRNTDVTEKFFVRVDVTEEFPFLITKLSPYYDR